MKVTYIEKGIEHDFKRIDREKTFYAISCFNPENTSIIYFKTDAFNIKAIAKENIISIEK